MKIDASYQPQGASSAGMTGGTRHQSDSEQKSGDILKGEIIDIRQDTATIRSVDGKITTARVVPPQDNIRVGQDVTVRLVQDEKGDLTFEFPKPEMKGAAVQQSALEAAGFMATPENLKLVDVLLANNSPIDKSTIQKLILAVKLTGVENLEKALFIMENEMKPTTKAIEKLDGYINGNSKIGDQLLSLSNEIMALPEGSTKEKMLEILFRMDKALPEQANPAAQQGQTTGVQLQPTSEHNLQAVAQTGQTAERVSQIAGQVSLATEPVSPAAEKISPAIEQVSQTAEKIQPASEQPQPLTVPISKAMTEKLQAAPGQSEEIKQQIQKLVTDAELVLGTDEMHQDADPVDIEKLPESVSERKKAAENIGAEKTKMLKHLSIGLKEATSIDEMERFINNLTTKISEMKAALGGSPEEKPELMKALNTVSDNLEFMNQVKTGVYLQMPLIINDHQTDTELFVFKDKRASKKQPGKTSALLALDLANLGHFETYVQKKNRDVECQFRVIGEHVETLVRQHLPQLEMLLKDHGYFLVSAQYRQQDQAFNILDDEPDLGLELDNGLTLDTTRRFSFDLKA